ncbi:MAG: hypothetical protein A2X59_10810 [Nitrospirae bacterium GWC2_42_7]|nr:MAG: hypothetical protein A2X59_10810 [Nitrospirae bacterium GWC2_42_7]
MNLLRTFKYSIVFIILLSQPLFAAEIKNKVSNIPSLNPKTQQDISSFSHHEQRIIVKFRESVSETTITNLHKSIKTMKIKKFKHLKKLQVIDLPAGLSVKDAIETYKKNSNVLYAEPDYIVNALTTPNDPSFSSQWALHNTGQDGGTVDADIDAPEAWDITTGSRNVVVAVVDTGIDYNHQDLSANMWRNEADCNNNGIDDDGNGYVDDCYGIDTFNYDSDPMDDYNHGTHVAGIIGAVGNNGNGISGVNWEVSIMACKFINSEGWGYLSGAIDCLEYIQTMKERGVNIIATNNSWGGFGYTDSLREAINQQLQAGILFIAAAGNSNEDNDHYSEFPASYHIPNFISVAAIDYSNKSATFSNSGRHSVHLFAPGVDILSSTIGNDYEVFSGTSMAAPHVTGVAALLKAQDLSRDWKAIKNLILTSGDDILDLRVTITQKKLNAYRSLTCSNSILYSRLLPTGKAIFGVVGTPIDLSVLHINCAVPNGEVIVTVTSGNENISLHDDGIGTDEASGDGIYSGQWTPSFPGIYSLQFNNGDIVDVMVYVDNVQTLVGNDTKYQVDNIAEAVAVGDLNNDGKTDIVVSTFAGEPGLEFYDLFVFIQGTNGELKPAEKYRVMDIGSWSGLYSVDIGDLNNDGRNDVAVSALDYTYPERNFISVLYQNETGVLGSMTRFQTTNTRRLRIGDLNGDGLMDIVSSGNVKNDTILDVYLQNSDGALDPPVHYQVPDYFVDLEIGDMNNDGLKDILVLGSGSITILYQRSDHTFDLLSYLGEEVNKGYASFTVGDINDDSLDDIIVTLGGNIYSYPKPNIVIFLQTVTGISKIPIYYPARDCPISVKVADINSDNKNDVVIKNNGFNTIGIYLQSPNNNLFPYIPNFAWTQSFNKRSLAAGDVNGDGANDIISLDSLNGLYILYNDSQASQGSSDLWVIKSGNGSGKVISSPSGIDCGLVCNKYFNEGTYITLTAIPDPDSYFEGWSDKICGYIENYKGTCTLMKNLNQSVQAHFRLKKVTATIEKQGSGSGKVVSHPPGIDCGTNCSKDYPSYTAISLTATPDPGSVFVRYSGRVGAYDVICPWKNPCGVLMNADAKVTAIFDSLTETLTVTKSGSGNGTVSSSPSGIDCGPDCSEVYNHGDSVTLTVTPDENSTFDAWEGDCTGNKTCTVKMDAPKSVKAKFKGIISLTSPTNEEELSACSYYNPPLFTWTTTLFFDKMELQFSLSADFSFIPFKASITTPATEFLITASLMKKMLNYSGSGGGIMYWRIVGTRYDGKILISNISSFKITGYETAVDNEISPTNKSAQPVLSWKNNCNTKFKVWFSPDSAFAKTTKAKKSLSFKIMNPNDNNGEFNLELTPAQWLTIRNVAGDNEGSAIYWYVESTDILKRYGKTIIKSFVLEAD